MAELDCMVATPEGPAFEGSARAVIVPAVDGELGILPRHAPLVAALGCGELRVDANGDRKRYFLEGGFVQVLNDRVAVLATRVQAVEDIDRAEAERLLEEAKQTKPAFGSPPDALDAYSDRVRVAKIRLKLAS